MFSFLSIELCNIVSIDPHIGHIGKHGNEIIDYLVKSTSNFIYSSFTQLPWIHFTPNFMLSHNQYFVPPMDISTGRLCF